MRSSRLLHQLLIVIFMAVLWLPLLLSLILPQAKISSTEKRKLAPMPSLELKTLNSFPENFEAYYNDHFGLRNTLVHWHNALQFFWLGTSTSKRVIVGRDGWLFQNGDQQVRDIRNSWPFSSGELDHWANILSRKHSRLQQQGILYVFLITPNKHLIYPEKLPSAYRPVQPTSRADQLIAHLRRHTEVPVVDLRPALLQAKKELRPYHKTDTHWNSYGAYIGYRELLKKLKKAVPDLRLVSLTEKDFSLVSSNGGDLAQSLSLHQAIQEQEPRANRWRATCLDNATPDETVTDVLRNKNSFATDCNRASHRLLMFRDSYSLAMMPYLSESFRYIYYVPHSPVQIENLIMISQEHQPDIVIEQRSTRWLRTPEG